MTPQKQRNLHRPSEGVWGDCHRAAFASVLDLPLDEVPHFFDGGRGAEEGGRLVDEFLLARGLVQITALYDPSPKDVSLETVLFSVGNMNPGLYYLLGGKSRTGVDHTVVCLGDRIVHDPSLADAGIVGPCADGYFWVTFIGSAIAKEKARGK